MTVRRRVQHQQHWQVNAFNLMVVSCLCLLPSEGLVPPIFTARTQAKQPTATTTLITEQQRQLQRQQQHQDQPRPTPPPPWSFDVKRIYYELRVIPVDQARRHCPPLQQQQSQQSSSASTSSSHRRQPLSLLSFGGYTLGGIFCVEYKSSPVGPYREVAILSSLLINADDFWKSLSSFQLPMIGAWASHIFVDSKDAQLYGEKFWGLPAFHVDSIEFLDDHSGDTNKDTECILFDPDSSRIVVSHWGTKKNEVLEVSLPIKFSLPSFSGLLPIHANHQSSQEEGKSAYRSPLLHYPLTILFASAVKSSISWVSSKTLDFGSVELASSFKMTSNGHNTTHDDDTADSIEDLMMLLCNSKPLVSIGVDNIQLEAGVATILSDS